MASEFVGYVEYRRRWRVYIHVASPYCCIVTTPDTGQTSDY